MRKIQKVIGLWVLVTLVFSFLNVPNGSVKAAEILPADAAAPSATSWCLAGDFNDWNNNTYALVDDGTNGDFFPGDGVFSREWEIAGAGAHYWKAVECGNWSNAHPAQNAWLFTDTPDQTILFTLDTNDLSGNAGMALLPASNIVNSYGDVLPTSYTAVGSFQGWNNVDPATLMTDLGNGYYRLVYTVSVPGTYIGKMVVTGTWDGFGADGRSVDAANIEFTTTAVDQNMVFLLDAYAGRALIQPEAAGTGTWCATGDFNGWPENGQPLLDDGTNGDLLGGDGVYSADVLVSTAGRYEWKVNACSWATSYPTTGNSWLVTQANDQTVKLSFDTNDHSADAGANFAPDVNILHAWDGVNTFTGVGDWQGWNNSNPATAFTELERGWYQLDSAIAAPGSYAYKVVRTTSWDAIGNDNRSTNADNISFTVNSAGDVVKFLLDYRTGRVGAFAPPLPTGAGHDNNIWWGDLGHNSRDTLYRVPGGPVTTGTPVVLRLRAASGDLTEAKLRLYNDRTNIQTMLDMSIAADDGTYEWWQATVPPSADPTVYWYRFIPIDGTAMDYYEDDAVRDMGWGETFDETNDYSYQITVFDPSFQTPDWIKNAVVYQVFPDRFRDGDITNNKPAGTFFYGDTGGSVYRSLTEDWNEEICDPRGLDACAGTYSKNFYGGDLQGLINKLGYLQALGVNTIYLNPIFESPSNHGYDTTDYMSLNPMFGDQTIFNNLVFEINNRNMHLILDGVFNHVSSDSIYFDRYGRYDEVGACESNASPYRSWFYFIPVAPGTGPCMGDDGTPGGANYESWWGYDSLPKLRANDQQVRDLIWDYTDNPTATVAGYWASLTDGWRLDVGGDVDPGTIGDPGNDYWEGFRNTVKAVNSDAYITGEEWGIANSWLLGGEWDAVMNYQFSTAVLSYWRDEPFTDNDHNPGSSAGPLNPLNAEQFDNKIQNLMERYAPEALEAMLNLFGSHDTSRALFMLDSNTDLNDPSLYANPDYDWSEAITRLKGAAIIQMTMPGAPTIYYGDEVGLVGPMAFSGGKWEDDPYNRQPFPWLDESGLPFYTRLQNQTDQDALYNYYALLTGARNAHPALRTGDYRTLIVDNDAKLYAYGRKLDGVDAAVVILNRGAADQLVDIDLAGYLPYGSAFIDVINDVPYTVDASGSLLDVNVPANSGSLLVLTNSLVASPAPVIDLAVIGVGDSEVNLAWTAIPGVETYRVYRSILSGGGYEWVADVATNNFTDTGLLNARTYYYVVVGLDTDSGLTSEFSNEVSAMPALTIDWANLQWPFTITHTIGITPTENIYGQVFIAGGTEPPGQTPGLRAQVGFGDPGTAPATWANWFEAEFNAPAGNNDEFKGSLLPEAVGIYDYLYRYTTTNGISWVYADQTGIIDGANPAIGAGVLTVVASSDTTPPLPPTVEIADWSGSFIDIAWSGASDDVAVYAYDVYRSLVSGELGMKIARVFEPDAVYHDTDVTTGTTYYYVVKAVDTSFNISGPSNQVGQAAEPKMVAVTFNVTVPSFTPGTVYLTRTINADGTVGGWASDATPLTKISDTLWSGTFNILDGTAMEFKFTRGTWETVIKGADGNEELGNLAFTVTYGTDGTQLYEYTVLNWRDPIVTAFSPADGATLVPVSSMVSATWSQEMNAAVCLTLTGPEGSVDGACLYDSLTDTVTFTPASPLFYETVYAVAVTGQVDDGGDTQQVPVNWTFTTEATPYGVLLSPESLSGSGIPGTEVVYTLTVENTGTVEDTYDIEYTGGWAYVIDPVGPITVAAGDSATITVTITIDVNAADGAVDNATLSVTSQSDGTVTDSTTLTTTAYFLKMYLPTILR